MVLWLLGSGWAAAQTVIVSPATLTLPYAAVGVRYSMPVEANGGTGPYRFTVTAGALPVGLSLNSGGLLSGTPTAGGTFNFTVTAIDSSDVTGSRSYSLEVLPPVISIAPPMLPPFTVASWYDQTISASGGTEPYTYAITIGALPAGLVLNNSTGALSGTPSAAGAFNFTITATDSSTGAGAYTGSRAYSGTVASQPTPSITGISPNSGPVAGGSSVIISGSNFTGATAVRFGGAPATGFTVNSATSITATAPAGSAGTVDITVTTAGGTSATGAADQYTYVAAPSVTSVSPDNGSAGSSVTITGSNFTGATAVQFGTTAAQNFTVNSATQISAIAPPATTGAVVNITVTTAGGTSATGTTNQFLYTLPAPTANGVSATVAANSSANHITLNITGGPAYSVAVASAPSHGTATATGTSITYTPTAGYAGSDSFTYTASNATGTSAPATVTITVSAPTITYTPNAPPSATVGQSYSHSLAGASGGASPYTYTITSGSLPAGLSLASNDGLLSGTPTAGGTFNFTVEATDSSKLSATSGSLSLTVAAPTISVSPSTLPAPTYNQTYSQTVSASGGTRLYTYAITIGSLPTGLTLNGTTGVISGTPTGSGSYNFTVTATDSSTGTGAPYTGTQNYSGTIGAPTITVSPNTLAPSPVYNQAYSQALSASGGAGPYTFAVTSGALPTGLTLSGHSISGTPTASGSYNFTITVTDSNGATGLQPYSGTITAPTITMTPASLGGATTGVGYTQALSASGGAAPYSFAITTGALPAGLTLNSGTGEISGTASTAVSASFTITATDAYGKTGSQPYTLTVTNQAPVAGPVTATVQANSTANPITPTLSGGTTSIVTLASGASHGTATASGTSIRYTPTPGYSGTDSFSYTATGPGGTSAAATATITVTAPTLLIAPSTASLPGTTQGLPYTQTLSASGGTAPYSFAIGSGSLPTGLALSPSGSISGTPSAAAHSSFTVTVSDSYGATGSHSYTLAVQAAAPTAPPVAVGTGPNQAVTINATANATGGPFTALAVSTQPASGTVAVQGMNLLYTPAASTQGAISFAYTLANAGGVSAPIAVTVQVAARPDLSNDASVRGIAMAQQQASLRFAGAQLMNFTQRLEQLRSPQRQAFQNGLQLAMPRAGNNSIRNCQNLPSLLGQQECIARQGMDSRASLVPSWSRAARQDAVAATQGLTAEQAYATNLEGNGSATSATLGGAQRNLAQRAAALAAGGQAGAPHTPQVYADEPLPAPGSAERPRLAYWTAGMVDWGFADATRGQDDGMRFTTSGVTLGVDYLVNSEWTVGVGVGFAYDRSTIGSDGSRNHSKGVSTALYGSWSPAPAYFVDGVLGYSRLRFDSRRWVADAGDYALGERDGTQWFASVSAGYEWRSPQMMLSPYGRLQWARSSLDGYTETGAGWHALRFEQQRITSSSASLGLRGETNHDTSWGQLLPFGRLELQHDFDGQSDVHFGYADLNGLSSTGYAISSSPIGRNRVQIGMGSRLQSRMGTFAAELQFTRSNTSFQRGLRLSYTTRY